MKTNKGEECATWDCDGKIVKGNCSILPDLKCNKCGREYWEVERKHDVSGRLDAQ